MEPEHPASPLPVPLPIHSAPARQEPVQIHHSWLTGLGDDAATALCTTTRPCPGPGRSSRSPDAPPHRAPAHPSPQRQPLRGQHIRDPRRHRRAGQPPHQLRRRPLAHRALPVRLGRRRRPDQHRIQLPSRRHPPAALGYPDEFRYQRPGYSSIAAEALRRVDGQAGSGFGPAMPAAGPSNSGAVRCQPKCGQNATPGTANGPFDPIGQQSDAADRGRDHSPYTPCTVFKASDCAGTRHL